MLTEVTFTQLLQINDSSSPSAPEYQDELMPKCIEIMGDLSFLLGSMVMQPIARIAIPEYLLQPLWRPEKSPLLSKVIMNYTRAARQMMANGTPIENIIGPDFVSVDLFFRDSQTKDSLSVTTWAYELTKRFSMVEDRIRLALVFLFVRLMKVRSG